MYPQGAVKLVTARTLRGMTQRELAEKADVSPVTIVKVEKVGRAPRAKTLFKIARALGMDPREIDEFLPTLGLGAE
jgi:transcriptional regulator with XRE-family HTH domain